MKTVFWPNYKGSNPIDLGLDRVFEALNRLGNPQNKLPKTIHIAGTNGKGSTLAFLRAMIEAEGKTCHVYTSPHLVEFNERIVIAGKNISDEFLNIVLQECKEKCDDLNLTFFEGTTIAALLAFSQVKADYLLLETGMGGRLDATNVMGLNESNPPMLTIITPISYDHMEFLGDTISKIAYEKACIIKENVPCIISRQPDEALKTILDYSKSKNSSVQVLGKDFNYKINNDGSFDFSVSNESLDYLSLKKPSLFGNHQYINATTAIAAALQISLSKNAIEHGVISAKWPARMQKLSEDFYLDGGHNAEAGNIIADYILQENKLVSKKNIAIVAMLNTKDFKSFIKNLSSAFDEIYITNIPNENNCRNPQEIKEVCDEFNIASKAFDNPESAINFAKSIDSRIVICGSLYLAGYVISENLNQNL
jgi:dihydrofolate synthase/folylpolyglutamate synthase